MRNPEQTQKLYRFEVDQSIRIEQMNKDTIIGIANQEQAITTKVPKRVKRRLQERYRLQGRPKLFAPQLFAAAIAVSLKHAHFRVHDLVIDIEYPGYEREIMRTIQLLHPSLSIYFTTTGRKSPAHYAAYGAYINKIKVDLFVSTKDILNATKNGPRTVTPLDKTRRFAAHIGPSTKHNTHK